MEEKAKEIFSFIQERCLWQFHSRTWDREQNINGVMDKATDILAGKEISIGNIETSQEKCNFADAKILVAELRAKFSWIDDMDVTAKKELMNLVKEKLIYTTITKSLNGELNVPFY